MSLISKRIPYNNRVATSSIFKLLEKFSQQIEATSKVDENTELLADIKEAKNEWINAHSELDYTNEKEIIDYNIYKIKACQSKYEYLIRKAKERGLKAQ